MEDVWIFGYGSLIWKADFPFIEQKTGCIKGFLRRFYQNSIEHRGTHDKPGRAVTLIPSSNPETKVWGIGYKISKTDRENVLNHLDYREKNGYTRILVDFFPKSFKNIQNTVEESIKIIIYIATEDNISYKVPKSIEDLVEQILHAKGRSGTNIDYVFKLADSFRNLFPGEADDHLFEIERMVKAKLDSNKQRIETEIR